jgi:uncharacterized membrane-anchored protein YitT (DUF2179 family)
MAYVSNEKLFSRKWFWAYSLITVGAFIMAVGYVLFIAPHKIVPGGVYGIGIVLNDLFNIPVGLTGLAFNIPLAIIGVRLLGPKFGVKTVVGFILASVFIDGLAYLVDYKPLLSSENNDSALLLSSIFGGVLIGLGLGLIFKARATSGGSTIIAMIFTKYSRIPIGQSLIIVDSIIVLFGLIVFQDWAIPLYSWIAIYITGKVIDGVLEGMSFEKTLFIISDKHKEISEKILVDLERGGTILEGKGLYKGDEKKIIFVNISRRELPTLQDFVHEIDPKAFLTVIDASQVLGEGFKRLEKGG